MPSKLTHSAPGRPPRGALTSLLPPVTPITYLLALAAAPGAPPAPTLVLTPTLDPPAEPLPVGPAAPRPMRGPAAVLKEAPKAPTPPRTKGRKGRVPASHHAGPLPVPPAEAVANLDPPDREPRDALIATRPRQGAHVALALRALTAREPPPFSNATAEPSALTKD